MDDLISRQAAINVVNAICERCGRHKEYSGVMCGACALDGVEDSIEDLPSADPEQKLDEWCTDCNEYDQEKNCCHRWNRVIRTTLEEMERQEHGKWIPVTERLPEERRNPNTMSYEYVLCSTKWGDVRPYQFGTTKGRSEPHFWQGCCIMDGYVKAWMPLPEPYLETE